MPIEFRCTHCQRLLRTADNTAGKQTKCPECGQIVRIPSASAAPSAAPSSPPPTQPSARPAAPRAAASDPLAPPTGASPFGGASGQPRLAASPFAAGGGSATSPPSVNPYISPSARSAVPGDPMAAGGALDVGDVMDRSWKIYVENLGQLILGMFLYLVAVMVGFIGLGIIMAIGAGIGGALSDAGNEAVGVTVIVISVGIFSLLLFGLSIWMVVGLFRWMLAVARGQPSSVGMIFSGGPYLFPAMGAGLLMTLAVFLGYLACILPGLFLALIFSQFLWLIIDRNAGAIDSLTQSMRLTEGNRMSLFLLFLIAMGISLVGSFIPFAFLFTAPFLYLMMAVAYLRMTGQTTADMLLSRPPTAALGVPPR